MCEMNDVVDGEEVVIPVEVEEESVDTGGGDLPPKK